jgi:hypothetical protein
MGIIVVHPTDIGHVVSVAVVKTVVFFRAEAGQTCCVIVTKLKPTVPPRPPSPPPPAPLVNGTPPGPRTLIAAVLPPENVRPVMVLKSVQVALLDVIATHVVSASQSAMQSCAAEPPTRIWRLDLPSDCVESTVPEYVWLQ